MAATTNIAQFLKKFKAHQQMALTASANTINEGLLNLYRNIVQRTPVGDPALWHPPYWPAGYKPGDLKKSWHINFDGQERELNGRYSNTANTLAGYGLSFKVGPPTQKMAVIYNSLPYAQRIEEGWSTQAPVGMLRVSVAEWGMLMNKAAAKYKIK